MQRYLQTPFHKAYAVGHLFPFNNRDSMPAALRTFIAPAVMLADLQFCRNENQFAADKLFPDLLQHCAADWTGFL